MKCKHDFCIDCDLAKNCACYHAVMQTYKTMADDSLVSEQIALEAAQRVYVFHRPHEHAEIAHLTVERWVNDTRIQ